MSVIDHSGLDGVSAQTSLVRPGFTAVRSAASEVMSTKSAAKCSSAARAAIQRRRLWYMTSGATTCEPGGRLWNTAAAAAMPEAKTSEAAPPSRAVINASGWS